MIKWKTELDGILDVAVEDTDQWVSTIAEFLKSFPQNGTINLQLEANSLSFNDIIAELRKLGNFVTKLCHK